MVFLVVQQSDVNIFYIYINSYICAGHEVLMKKARRIRILAIHLR